MSALQELACLIAYAPVAPEAVRDFAREVNEVQLSDKVPGIDHWLDDNSIRAYTVGTTTGRVRGRAWGVSNPFTNFRSVVGADFVFEWVLDPSSVASPGQEHRFSVDIETDGRFLHVAAVPTPDDSRTPVANTVSQMTARLEIFRVTSNGSLVEIANSVDEADHFVEVQATAGLNELIETSCPLEQVFVPNGQDPVLFRVTRSVIAAARGSYSDIRIRGSAGRRNFRTRVRNRRVQRVLAPDDPCARFI